MTAVAGPPSAAWLDQLASTLAAAGLDLVYPFVAEPSLDELFPLERFGRQRCLGLVIANTRALWAPFTDWYRKQPGLAHPLHHYLETTIPSALATPSSIYYAHRLDYWAFGKQTAVPIQRLGQRVGFAALGPAHLSAHQRVGPWFAYRALVTVNAPPPELTHEPAAAPCHGCSGPCESALATAVAASPGFEIRSRYRLWLAVRDACPIGKDSRYSEPQLRYHYVKDPQALWDSGD